MRRLSALAFAAALLAGPALAQTSEWRTVAPENLLVIETTRGRVLIELMPDAAPGHVERIQTLTRRGFYDGTPFHRVMTGFMAQTGDPTGTGLNGSDLPDLPAEFSFRRGPEPAFAPVTGSDRTHRGAPGSQLGIYGSLPVTTQPDGQMFATRDGRVDASALFCTGVIGAARTGDNVNSANSQFFIMTASNMGLNGQYSVWGHIVGSMDPILALQAGDPTTGRVPEGVQDRMVRVRLASDIPEAERPAAQVLDVRSERFRQLVETTRAAQGSAFSICDITLPTQVTN